MSSVHEPDQRSLADLIRELRDESTALLREEMALAKAEMSEKAGQVGRNATLLVVGGVVAHLGLIFLLLAATAGLENGLVAADLPFSSDWLAPLIVGAVVGVVGLILVLTAKKKLSETTVMPEKTVNSLKEDKQWIQNKMR